MANRVLSLTVYRLVLICLALGYQLAGTALEWPLMPFRWALAIGAGVGLLSLGYLIYWNRAKDRLQSLQNLVFVQFFFDVIAISVLVVLTGGIQSSVSAAYLAVIVLAAIFLEKFGIYVIAILSLSFYYFSINLTVLLMPRNDPASFFFSLEPQIARAMSIQFALSLATALISGFMQAAYRSSRKALDERERRIESLRVIRKKIVESLPSGLIICDLDGGVDFVNHMGQKLLQQEEAELTGRNVFEIFKLNPAKEEGKIEGRFVSRAERAITVGGVRKTFGVSFSSVDMESGKDGYMVVFQDLTEIKMLERHKALEDRMSAVGKVAAGVAHEIRNPLAAISGSVQVLKEIMAEDETAQELARIVEAETRRLNDFISQFLAYAKPGSPPLFRPIDLRERLNEFGQLAANDPRMKGLRLEFEFEGEAPVILGDRAKLNQVFWNLVRNAWQACSERGSDGRVKVSCRTENEDVVVCIADNGVGMTEEEVKDLFTPFQSYSKSGVGLGMTIVYDMIQMHRGKIDVKSVVGEGTCVELRFHRYGNE